MNIDYLIFSKNCYHYAGTITKVIETQFGAHPTFNGNAGKWGPITVVRMESIVASVEDVVRTYNDELSVFQAKVDEPEQDRIAQRAYIEQSNAALRARDNEIMAKDEAMRARDEEIMAKDEAMRAKDEEMKAKDEAMRARDEEMKAKDEEMKAKDEERETHFHHFSVTHRSVQFLSLICSTGSPRDVRVYYIQYRTTDSIESFICSANMSTNNHADQRCDGECQVIVASRDPPTSSYMVKRCKLTRKDIYCEAQECAKCILEPMEKRASH
ncbi:hypothetical protein BD410DRAFT_516118 [Rickenella mellea]|uniref:Uncharacterized protein n=1 Tax=Rickenella mellea TaxID=50990 RepID=A0A4Y7PRD7_9AGAM|nr:hypothetical protein BD410DRAFT_516118 [Rickenella mellea]